MHVRSLGFRTDLALLTLTGSVVEDRGTHLVVRTPDNPTYFWGNFILLAEPPFAGGEREVVAAFQAEFPDASHVSIGIDQVEDRAVEDEVAQRFAEAGLDVDRAVVLTASSVHQPLRSLLDVDVRPLESDADWQQRAELSCEIDPGVDREKHLGFALRKNSQERALVAAGHGQRFGAFSRDVAHDGEGKGRLLSTAGIFRTDGGVARFQSVETHPDARRQGLAATVVHAGARHALDHLGAQTLVIVADEAEDAIRIYRRLGFADTERQLMLERRPPHYRD